MANNVAIRNVLGRMIYAPTFLIISSTARLVISCNSWLIDSLEAYHYLLHSFPSLFVCLSTWIIWQCYFANSVASVQAFSGQWGAFVRWQRWLFCAVGLLLLLVAFAVAVGVLQLTNGPSPSLLLQMVILTPAALWFIPVLLPATLAIFRMNGNGAVEQARVRAVVHIVHLVPYFVFLRSSQLDDLVGAGGISVCTMFGVTFLGFILQLLWHMYTRMPAEVLDEQAGHLQQEEQEQAANPHQEQEQATNPHQEEQERGRSELVISVSCAMHMEERNALQVVVVNHKLPSLNDTDQLVINSPSPVPRFINT